MRPEVVTLAKRRAQGLTLCLIVALGFHAVVLAWSQGPQGERHGKPTTALEVRMLSVMPAPAVAVVAAVPEQLSNARMATPAPVVQPVMQPLMLGESHEDAQAPLLDSPDAALPGGRGQARVWLSVETDGYVRELHVEPDVLPPAFERAIERAFAGSRVPLEQANRRSGSLCVEVEFRDGEAPSWQAIEPAGVCPT